MSSVRKPLRYLLVIALWPSVHLYDRLTGVSRPASFRRGLDWARGVHEPAIPTATKPARVRHPNDPFEPTIDPCTGCGCAKADHLDGRCVGDFLHCPCETWMPLDDGTHGVLPGGERRG